ncbi:BZ3500_MvSof-1268-A1-R1_Chr11-1g03302 [Microbotryum saponariae]|uniref:BZ3500_MvSof-1268-A1-R1_Chr11-1g03302 protein n=1 Tax=Microbotryum saponariae TaxID=289078 RepID=A0A2X0LDR8_9BASI|nr:BZ3500_MvSof-1268-A1-R1_Chr11-1g03302 [Microbotryum saponariae]
MGGGRSGLAVVEITKSFLRELPRVNWFVGSGWRHMYVFEYWFIKVVMLCCVAFKER